MVKLSYLIKLFWMFLVISYQGEQKSSHTVISFEDGWHEKEVNFVKLEHLCNEINSLVTEFKEK